LEFSWNYYSDPYWVPSCTNPHLRPMDLEILLGPRGCRCIRTFSVLSQRHRKRRLYDSFRNNLWSHPYLRPLWTIQTIKKAWNQDRLVFLPRHISLYPIWPRHTRLRGHQLFRWTSNVLVHLPTDLLSDDAVCTDFSLSRYYSKKRNLPEGKHCSFFFLYLVSSMFSIQSSGLLESTTVLQLLNQVLFMFFPFLRVFLFCIDL